MIIPDANLLIYAYDSTSREHAVANAWWAKSLGGSEPIGIPWVVLLAFTRILSHPQICANPLPVEEIRRIVLQDCAGSTRWRNPRDGFRGRKDS